MATEYKLGVIIGVLVGIIAWSIVIPLFLKLTKTDGAIKCKYDERQQIVQGKGYRYAFFVLILYNFFLGLLDSLLEIRYADMGTEMILGVLFSVMVYVVYCIWNDGYFSLNENIARVLVGFGIFALINVALGMNNLRFGGLVENGRLTFRSLSFFCGFLFLVIFIATGIKYICGRRSEKGSE